MPARVILAVMLAGSSLAWGQEPQPASNRRLGKLIRDLQAIIQKQEAIKSGIADEINTIHKGTRLHPKLHAPGGVLLRTGEARIVTIRLDWQLYKESEFFVDVASSDQNVVGVPRRLHIDERRHETDFELELKTGAHPDTAIVRLTPAWGAGVVQFRVTVK